MLYGLDSSGRLYGTMLVLLIKAMKFTSVCTVLQMVSKFIPFKMQHFKLLYLQAYEFYG